MSALPDPVLDHAVDTARARERAGRLDEAAALYARVLTLQPAHKRAALALGSLLNRRNRPGEAREVLEAAAAARPGDAHLLNNAGLYRMDGGDIAGALACYRRAAADFPVAASNALLALHYDDTATAADLFAAHEAWGRTQRRRTRIGFVSGDFRRHSVAYFLEPVLRHYDREGYRVTLYHTLDQCDGTTATLRALADRYQPLHDFDDDAAAAVVKVHGIDVLVDLAGHTAGNRLGVFARRAAPVQCTWLGYPDTTGLPQMDYRLTDAVCDPAGSESRHAETLLRLGGGCHCYAPPEAAPPVAPPPVLANGYVTFGCFGALQKYSDSALDLWVSVLRACPGSRLLLKNRAMADAACAATLRRRLETRGIGAERVTLLPQTVEATDHLARYARVDIALDTTPYAGCTTTCEALWMGVPVVTLLGDACRGRLGASVLASAGLQGWIARTERRFVDRALLLARQPETLERTRRTLRARLRASALLDGARFTRRLESVFDNCLETAR